MLGPYLIGRRGPGAFIGTPGGGGSGGGESGGMEEEPIVVTTTTGDTTIKGKIKPGSFGRFVFPLATVAAGRQYTLKVTPHFSQLAQQGKLAMTGFGFKTNNDFHLVGLRGDGSTGLHRYRVSGTSPNGWNKDTGHTVTDSSAPTNGTQAGPNWYRLIVSADGATYEFQTSGNSGASWEAEFSGITPTPFSNVSGAVTFGIALWFNNLDAGPFSVDIAQFADAAAPVFDAFTGVVARNSVDLTLQDYSSFPVMTWDTDEVDTNTLHDTGSNTGRITIPAGLNGKYGVFSAFVQCTFHAGEYFIGITKGGAPNYIAINSFYLGAHFNDVENGAQLSSIPQLLATGDIYEAVFYNSVGNVTRKSNSNFSMYVVA